MSSLIKFFLLISTCLAMFLSSAHAQSTTSIATYYYRVGSLPDRRCAPVQSIFDPPAKGGFRGVYGACGGIYGTSITSKYGVAISQGKANCGRRMRITYGSKSIIATVIDQCPGCNGNQKIDMSLDAMTELMGPMQACSINTGLPRVRWQFIK